ncbi:Ankyrin repeat domain-containing protein [Tetrabaena socialis]|uniref:Ankyrin repeat domain-containing protein n=1 Tax=Tetrabaena socialis TaxID=47790 RepID=A0A2J7ZYZ0_9CHLO|nr:Ankyrin repeat domain-containing protein [Tetrabaena socialis]|eukprot:PNH05489.1 Ankyrin repeat domain-containing protein [Tetrabaena socialis]
MCRAVLGGNVAVMEVLHARGVLMGEETVRRAAAAGYLPGVAWLVEMLGAGTALTTHVFAAAAQAGSMEPLAWLRERGCPWDATVFAAAAEEGSEEQLEWLAEQGCPMGDDGAPYAHAAANGELAILRCLRRLSCPWSLDGGIFTRAVGFSHTTRIRQHVERGLCLLLEQGCPVDWDEAELAAAGNEQQLAAATSDPSRIWLPELVQRFAVSLTSNEVACALRLVNKATAAQFSTPQHTTIRLSQPVPHHAFARRWGGPNATRTLAQQQRLELPRLTARSGSIANLEVLLAWDDLPPILDPDVFRAAAAAGQLDVCVWLRQQGCPWCVGYLAAAAEGGHRAVCEWLLANGYPEMEDQSKGTAAAARGGHVDLMDWLLLRAGGAHVAVSDSLAAAAEGCDLRTLQRLYRTHVDAPPVELPVLYTYSIISAAAGSPTADWQAKVEWLEARGYPLARMACEVAAAKPDALPRLQWLRQRGYPFDVFVAECAAGAGNVEALQYVLSQGGEVGELTTRRAVQGGHVAVMEVLHARGVPMGEEVVMTAAAAGHLPAVAWLVERLGAGAALTAHVFAAAAQAGSMELLAWLREKGCPWDAMVFAAAAEGGSEEQLEWLAEQGCPMGDDGAPYAHAAANGELAILRCLRRLSCPWSPDGGTFTRAVGLSWARNTGQHAERGLCWLLDRGCPVDWDERANKRQRSQSPASPPQQQLAAATSDPPRIWLPELVQRFAVSLTSNEVACTLRLVNKATAAQFSTPQHTTVRLSQPVPHHAFVRRWAGPDAMRTLARRQRFELSRLTARSGSIANLEVLLARDDLPLSLNPRVFMAAAAAGQLDVCVWLRQQACPRPVGLLAAAAEGGHRAVCEWVLANGYYNGHARITQGGRLLLLQGVATWTSWTGCCCTRMAPVWPQWPRRLHHPHVGTLPGGPPAAFKPGLISTAAGSPTADWQAKVEWLEARGYPQARIACEVAAAQPDALPRLQWLRQRGYPFNAYVADSAAGAGNMEALQYVLGQGGEVDGRAMQCAAQGGHVAVMEVLHARGVLMGEEGVRRAAKAGHLPAVAWLVERLGAGTALTTHVFAAAAQAGSMELLAWLRERGCPWDATVFDAAAEEGSEEQLEWLAEQGCPMGVDGAPYARAAASGELAILRCLRRLSCLWSLDGGTFTRAVGFLRTTRIRQHVERGLCWLLEQGCPVDWDEAELAAAGNEVLKRWVHARR